MQKNLERILADAVDRGDVAHAACVVTDANDLLYQGQAGPCWSGDPARMLSEDTIYWIHSMTKPLTAAAVMQLVEQGRIGLDDDCGDLIATLKSPQVLEGFDQAGVPVLRPAKGTITLRRLLTHTAGFAYDRWNFDQRDWIEKAGLEARDFFDDPATCPPLASDPGTRWEYGINIDWAGKVLEVLSGQCLADYVQAHIIAPLGMTSTGYILTDALRPRLAGVHQRDPEGHIHAASFTPPPGIDPKSFTGGGGMFGSAADYARFMRMILNDGILDGNRVLAADTVRQMKQNQMGDIEVEALPTTMPDGSFAIDLYPGVRKGWGLSFMRFMEDLPGRRRAGSLAWAGLRNTYFWIDPQSGIGAALFTQMLPFADPKTLVLLDDIERAVYADRQTG